MVKNYNRFILILLSCIFTHQIVAQDPVFSQFYANKLYLNPAFTGFHEGTAANINYRSQWGNVRKSFSKFETRSVGVSTSVPCKNSGFGIIYTDNTQGEGYLKWQNVAGSYAYTLPIDKNKNNSYQLSFGLRVNYSWRSLNWQNLVFSDQLDAINGVVGQSQYPVPANYSSQSKPYWDADAGVVFFQEKSYIGKGYHRKLLFKDFRAGFSVNHLAKNNTSVTGFSEYQPKRWSAHLSWLHPLTPDNTDEETAIYLNPIVKFDYQKASKNTASVSYTYMCYGVGVSTKSLYGGVYIQNQVAIPKIFNTNSLVTTLGYGWDTDDLYIRFGLSKDFNLSGFTNYGGGAWEASLIINPKGAQFCDPNSASYRRRMRNACRH